MRKRNEYTCVKVDDSYIHKYEQPAIDFLKDGKGAIYLSVNLNEIIHHHHHLQLLLLPHQKN